MHIHELLDRFELLYAEEKPILADLRRAVLDDDLSSIFRVADAIAIEKDNIDNLRKATMEKNLHSIFRVIELFDTPPFGLSDSDLVNFRKAVTEKNHRAIFRVFTQCGITDELEDLRKAMTEKNLNAVFRIFEQYKDADIDDIRKTILEENLHALFRLLEHYELDVPLEDLRKAIVEENLHSIFRVIEMYQEKELIPLSVPIEDLRKSIVEENLYSIFRILPRVDSENRQMISLRKIVVINGDDDERIRLKNTFDLIGLFVDSVLLDTLRRVISTFPEANIKDAYSQGQILSKKWLIKELKNLPIDLGTVFLCAGWYGTLGLMLFESGMKVTKIRSFDLDDDVWPIAETINRPMVMSEWQFKAQTEDINNINYKDGHTYQTYRRDGEGRELYDKPDTVINTSCEHIENFREWYDKIGKGTLVILQTNNYHEIEDHVNCVDNIEQFKEMAPMTDCMYEGELNLDKYNRFMLIGYR